MVIRFDDRLTTLLARVPGDVATRAAVWAQLADAFAQGEAALSPEQHAAILAKLLDWRHDVVIERRRMVSASLASRHASLEIVGLFASDVPEVSAPMLCRARLPEAAWVDLIPRLTPSSRGLLRQRRDLPPAATRTLRLYAAADQALPAAEGGQISEQVQPIQIRDLVARIEAYRRVSEASLTIGRPAIATFRFETGPDGTLIWVQGAPAAGLIGMMLADPAQLGEGGADQTLAAAVAGQGAFEAGILKIGGEGELTGAFDVRGRPFRTADGHFAGFRCVARRVPGATAGKLLAGGLAAESVRQLAHELRTPLNAIRGFADLIAGQFLGPTPAAYRLRAEAVANDAAELSEIIGDLDKAARIDMDPERVEQGGECDAGAMVRKTLNRARLAIDAVPVALRVITPLEPVPTGVDPEACEELTHRFLMLSVAAARPGEALTMELTGAGHLSIEQAESIAGLSAEALRRSTLTPDEHVRHGPRLGFGFAFKLLEALVAAHGGALDVAGGRLLLRLPRAVVQPATQVA